MLNTETKRCYIINTSGHEALDGDTESNLYHEIFESDIEDPENYIYTAEEIHEIFIGTAGIKKKMPIDKVIAILMEPHEEYADRMCNDDHGACIRII